jgi:hypothetical protein
MIELGERGSYRALRVGGWFTGRVITLIIDSIAIVRNIDNVYTLGGGGG